MSTFTATPAPTDWHGADVIAALKKKGLSLRGLAKAHDYGHIDKVLKEPWLAAEEIIAAALGLHPSQIWPSRWTDPDSRLRAFQLTRKVKLSKPSAKRRTKVRKVAA